MKIINNKKIIGPILIVLPKFIGDVINTLPALELLSKLYPKQSICVLARPYLCELLKKTTISNLQIIEDKRDAAFQKQSLLSLAKYLKSYNFSLAILFRGSLREAILCRLARIKLTVGYAQNLRSGLLSHALKLNPCHHYIHRYCRLVNDTHGQPFNDYSLPTLVPSPLEKALPSNSLLKIGLYFGGENKGSRHYPIGLSQQILTQYADQFPCHFYLFGDKTESKDNARLQQRCTDKNIQLTDLSGATTLPVLIDYIAVMDLMISIDSGPMHMACAVNTPCVALVGFGTSAWSSVEPKNNAFKVIRNTSKSLIEANIITSITPKSVVIAGKKLLER
ncbi:glycosyltransferase family 9 protein [Pseudoalteromonas sp. MMG012]|uniref:glycosyltransferase family 9 protein n=1 Tax=Pseudoalteromonas sp. MMG012 TaxID=2822686 RepID=UPI001B39D187|nr:glycosyltransferase family 9 protein [Pseudoalteromonas sp. MMG012]MBQ4849370.1 glycosyltransferase family 9 protein [Pseudoalteromonas sp. MMG012]